MHRRTPHWFGVMLVTSSALLTACGTQPLRPSGTYTVRAGDTLYSIAWRHGVDFHELARINHIGNDYRIYPGQVLALSTAARARPPVPQSSVVSPSQPPTVLAGPPPRFLLPVSGSYVPTSRPNGGVGLVFSGRVGDDIHAAAAGRVVYSGNGLLGYGQLLIIKHNEQYLSAYGHLQVVNVREGDAVTSGQVIATMGAGPNGTPQLYFEIRVDGRPVEPTALLQATK